MSEANVIKSFKSQTSPVFNKGKLVYDTKTHEWYKVLDLKTDDNYKPTWASIAKKGGTDSIEITKEEDFDNFTNTLTILIKIEGEKSLTIETTPKIYDKFETAFEGPFDGAGETFMSYKLFFNSKMVEKDQCLATIDGIKDGDIIYASEGLGKPFKFNRFMEVNTSWGWSNSGGSPDGIMFKPTKNIKVCGFSTFAARDKDSYEIRYRVRIDGVDVEDETIVGTNWEDKYYFRHTLNGVYNASAGSKIEFTCWIAENLADRRYVETFSGQRGDDYKEVENEHMGLFEIESGGDSCNGTGVYSGHFPEIFYYLG